MADVQLENGYLSIALSLYEALLRTPLPGRHLRVYGAMIRFLYGWKKTEDRIASSQVSQLTGIHDRDVREILDELLALNMLEAQKERGRPALWRIQKDFERWGTPRLRTPPTPRVDTPGSVDASAPRHPGVSTPATPRLDTPGTPRLRTPDHRKKTINQRKSAGQAAVAAFCDGFKEKRGATYAVSKPDAKWLRQTAEQLGAEPFKALLGVFFGIAEDRWVAAQGWNVNALRQRWQDCHAKAQMQSKARERLAGHGDLFEGVKLSEEHL